ncbi:hypothetical protein B0H11DRAFT_2375060 [Mycena galericulata]|nr:hypothetical protein B0H11DRAFT_2375060 [Mycena galericulata]
MTNPTKLRQMLSTTPQRQAEINGGLAEDFDTWRVAVWMYLRPFQPQIDYRTETFHSVAPGLAVFNNPDNIQTKFVVLLLRKRMESASTPRKMFEYVRIDTFDRSALQLSLLFGLAWPNGLRPLAEFEFGGAGVDVVACDVAWLVLGYTESSHFADIDRHNLTMSVQNTHCREDCVKGYLATLIYIIGLPTVPSTGTAVKIAAVFPEFWTRDGTGRQKDGRQRVRDGNGS